MAPGSSLEEEMRALWDCMADIPSAAPRFTKRNHQGNENGSAQALTPGENDLFDELLFDQVMAGEDLLGSGYEYNEFMDSAAAGETPSTFGYPADARANFPEMFSPSHNQDIVLRKTQMRTGCVACLIKGKRCDPRDPQCKLAMSDEWNLNYVECEGDSDSEALGHRIQESRSLTTYRPYVKWRINWRERHSLDFFVNFSAPQMAGFFDNWFWQTMVIQTSYYEPAIRHVITAIGALHEAILQRTFADEKRKMLAMEFALSQCNRAIVSLTGGKRNGLKVLDSRLALTTCVLFTCFEAMQGRCNSAVDHALQGGRLLQAIESSHTSLTPSGEDDIEKMRPFVERLELQGTALLDKGTRPGIDASDQAASLPPIECIFSLNHAHDTLHVALNSVMRFMQGFHSTASRQHIALAMEKKKLWYVPWFQRWELAFTAFLEGNRNSLSNIGMKRAMVLKANHLVGTMLASVDQSVGTIAYDAYEAEFKAIVDLSREVLSSFPTPPVPPLSSGMRNNSFLSFSLWVTDPLWMALSRCRNPSVRQAAFNLFCQNPKQEGIWHAGPNHTKDKHKS